MNGNTHKQHDCPYCWRVLYSKGALTNHLNKEHWDEEDDEEEPKSEYKIETKTELADEPA